MLRQYTERRTDETDGSEVLGNHHREVAEKQLIPRIIKRNRQAILMDPHHFHFFQRKKQGRRCSCFKVETSPDGLCQVCHGTGIVGGYEKFGTVSDMFDVTYPRMRSVNIRQDFEAQTRPVMFRLVEGAVKGYIEFDWQIKASRKKVDIFQVISRDVGESRQVKAFVRSARSEIFVPLTTCSINEVLYENSAVIRVELSRSDPTKAHPILSHVYIRYLLIDDTTVRMDVPRVTESIVLAEYGVFDSFTSMTGWLTDEVKTLGTEDFFRRLRDHTFWKAIEEQPNAPLQQTTSHDVTLRLIQNFEAYKRFPV